MKKNVAKRLTRSGIIAALYVVTTFAVLPVASGAIQFRPSEALTLLPLFFMESVPALFIGCLIANLISGCAILDIVFGSLITLLSALLTYLIGRLIKNSALKIILGGFFPIVLNAFLLPIIWYYVYGQLEYMYILNVFFLLISQSVSIYVLGTALFFGIKKATKSYPELFNN